LINTVAATSTSASIGGTGSTPSPEEIRKALRLGWVMAEVHGRNRLDDDPRLLDPSIQRAKGVLPLAVERSPAELRIEAESVLKSLVDTDELNPVANDLREGHQVAAAGTRAADQMTFLAKELHNARQRNDAAATGDAWGKLAELLYLWDARIQDVLAADAFGIASAYQLGRGVAEVYWALDQQAKDGAPGSWTWVLSTTRCDALKGMLERLAGNLPDGVVEAIAASLSEWRKVATSPTWRSQDGVLKQLNRQMQTWRDLLITGFDPQAVVGAAEGVRKARAVLPYLGAFLPELAGLVVAIFAVGGAIYFITSSHDPFWGAILSGLGTLGVTSAAIVARLKVVAGNLVEQLQRLVKVDMIKANSLYLPTKPHSGLARALPSRESMPKTVGAQLLADE
jgi:hypothetical protein